jgi:membrane protease YdiL (CAAX protease family)
MRRRRLVVLATIVLGALALGLSLRLQPGDTAFYPATFALAGVWVVGALVSGPLRLGRIQVRGRARRPLVTPFLVGLGLAGIFVLGALLVRGLPVLGEQVRAVLGFAVEGPLALLLAITVVNGVAEELFFRGAVYEVAPRHPIAVATVANVAVVVASGNLMLGFAAAVLAVVAGLLRRATGGVLAPTITHVTWSTAMLLILPWVFG